MAEYYADRITYGGNTYKFPAIDDTAGEGVTDKTWSANKLSSENTLTKTITTTAAVQSFTDGAEWPMEMEIAVEPVQDLHGYDKPWPAGGGKNHLGMPLSSAKADNTSGTWSGDSYTINGVAFKCNSRDGYITSVECSGTASYNATIRIFANNIALPTNNYILNGCPANGGSDKYELRLYSANATSGGTALLDYGEGVNVQNTFETRRVTITIRTGVNSNGLVFYPMLRLSTVSDATFVPYSNICPITGWDGANVTGTGKNLLLKKQDVTDNGITITWNDDSTVNINGTASSATGYIYLLTYDDTKEPLLEGDCIFSMEGLTATKGGVYAYNADRTVAFNTKTGTFTHRFTNGIGRIYLYFDSGSVVTGNHVKFMVRKATEQDDTWEPIQRTIYPITFPSSAGTVCSGTLTVHADRTGTLVVDKDYFLFDGTDSEYWDGLVSNHKYFRRLIAPINTYQANKAVSNMYQQGPAATNRDVINVNVSGENNDAIYISPSWATSSSTVSDLMTYLASNNLQVIATRVTPITYTLPAPQVLSLLGQNNVWADCGNINKISYVRNFITPVITDRINGMGKSSSKPFTVTLDTVTGSGSYTHTTSNTYVNSAMKPIGIEYSNPGAFLDEVSITTADGSITLTCANVVGTSTVTVTLMTETTDQEAVSDSEFDVLAGRIANANEKLNASNSGAHNSIYRGKYLGSSVTSSQWDSISNGTFDDLYIGDYWTIGGVNWRIAAFDYWYNTGISTDSVCHTHHAVIVPDESVTSSKLNSSDTTYGGFVGTNFYQKNNDNTGYSETETAINNAFGSSHILVHDEYFTSAVTNGYASNGTWVTEKIVIMNEPMVFGCRFFDSVINGTTRPHIYTIDNTQLPLFNVCPSFIRSDFALSGWWLRDVASSDSFAKVTGSGMTNVTRAGVALGIRPAFGIK